MFCSDKTVQQWHKNGQTILSNRAKLNHVVHKHDYYEDFSVLYFEMASGNKPSSDRFLKAKEMMLKVANGFSGDLKSTVRDFVSVTNIIYESNEVAALKSILQKSGIVIKDSEAQRKAEEEARRRVEEEVRKREQELLRRRAEEEARMREEARRLREQQRRKEEESRKPVEYDNITEVKNWRTNALKIIQNRQKPAVVPFYSDFRAVYFGIASNTSAAELTQYINKLSAISNKVNNSEIKLSLRVFVSISMVAVKSENRSGFIKILRNNNLTPKSSDEPPIVSPTNPQPKPQQPRPVEPNPQPKPQPRPKPTRSSNSPWERFNDFIEDIGDWFDDMDSDDAVGVAMFLAGGGWVIYMICSLFSEGFWGSIIPGILSAIAAFVIYLILCFVLPLAAFIFKFIFRNAITFLITLGVVGYLVVAPIVRSVISSFGEDKIEQVVVQERQSRTYVCTAKSLNVRSAANATASVVGSLTSGQEVLVYEITNGFAEIEFNGETAYASASYLSQKSGAPTSYNTTHKSTPTKQTKQAEPAKPAATSKPVPKATSTPVTTPQPSKIADEVKVKEPKPTVDLPYSNPTSGKELYANGLAYYRYYQYSEATACFEKASNMDNADAQYYLGVMYANGTGVVKNPVKGFEYMKRAALGGNKQSYYNLAEMYYNGNGTSKDMKEAKNWYKKSADSGNEMARRKYNRL